MSTPGSIEDPLSRFLSKLKKSVKSFEDELEVFKRDVINYERRDCKDYLSGDGSPSGQSEDDKASNEHVATSVTNRDKVSRFDGQVLPGIVNLQRLDQLLRPLKDGFSCWRTELGSITPSSGIKVSKELFDSVLSCFYVFLFYRKMREAASCALLATRVSLLCRDYRYQVASCILRLQVALCIGDYMWGNKTVEEFDGIVKRVPQIIESFDGVFFSLLRVDLDIRLGRGDLHLDICSTIIGCEYLKSMTANRYFLKAFAWMTITKFPADVFQRTLMGDKNEIKELEEFTDPIAMMFTLIRRHDPEIVSWSAKDGPSKAEEKRQLSKTNDPTWIKFLFLNYSIEAFHVAARFHMNAGTPLDSEYFHNLFMRFARCYCSLFHLRQLLVSAANADRITDRLDDALFKVTTSLDLFKKRRFQSVRDKLNETIDVEDVDDPDLNGFIKTNVGSLQEDNDENCSGHGNGCLHVQKNVNVHLLKKKAIKKSLQSDDKEDYTGILSNKDYFEEGADKVDLFGADATRIEALLILCLLKSTPSSTSNRLYLNKTRITQNVKPSLDIVRDILTDIRRDEVSASRLSKSLSSSSTSSRNDIFVIESAKQMLTMRLQVWRACIAIEGYLQKRRKDEAMNVASVIFNRNYHCRVDCLEGYASRVQFAEFLLLYSKVMMDNSKSKRLEYNAVEIESSFQFSIGSTSILVSTQLSPVKCRTSSSSYRKQVLGQEERINREKLLRAPKGKGSANQYEVPELKDYYIGLGEAQALEKKETRSTRSTRSLRSNKHESGRNESPAQKYRQFMDSNAELFSPIKKSTHNNIINKFVLEEEVINKNKTKTVRKEPSQQSQRASNFTAKSTTFTPVQQSLPTVGSILDIVKQSESLDDKERSRKIVKAVRKFLGNHPPVVLYRMIHQILSDYHDSIQDSVFHSIETVSVAFRFFSIKTFNRRERKESNISFDRSLFSFSSADIHSDVVKRAFDRLPTGSRIIQIQIDEDIKKTKLPNLILTRMEKAPKGCEKKPVSIKIMSDAMKHTKFFMEELTTLIELSNASILERIPATFWSTRNALDKRVKGLLESVEHAWLGPWISFFIGKVYGSVSTDISFRSVIKTIATAIKKEAEKKSLCCLDEDLLQILCEGTPFLSKEMLFYGLSFLFGSSDRDFLESCNRIVDQWLNFIVSPTGKLEEDTRFDQIYGTLFTPMPVALIVGQSLELFPWESLPTLLKCDQSFYRIPNVRFLAASLEVFASQADSKESQCARLQKGENSNSVYYLLNPTNNLEKTEVKFKDRFESMEGWDGLSGRAPEPEALRSSLENKDVYIFFGHGAGSTYYRSLKNNLEGVNLHSSGFIIGCSSGRLRCDGDSLEPTGIPYRYLLNGSPSYVGVLWDVTDGDIDTFADNFMQEWFTRDVWSLPEGDPKHPLVIGKTLMRTSKELIGIKGPNLCDATTTARSSCKLKFLIGAAPVVYGLPLSVRVCLIPRSHWSATQTIRTIPAVTDKSHEMKSEKGKTKSSSTK